jgi:hypothetical protein
MTHDDIFHLLGYLTEVTRSVHSILGVGSMTQVVDDIEL